MIRNHFVSLLSVHRKFYNMLLQRLVSRAALKSGIGARTLATAAVTRPRTLYDKVTAPRDSQALPTSTFTAFFLTMRAMCVFVHIRPSADLG